VDSALQQALSQIDAQHNALVAQLTSWCSINSGTDNIPGLAKMAAVLREAFSPISDESELISLSPGQTIDSRGQSNPRPLGQLLRFTKRPSARRRVLLVIHYDTVYGPDHPFQQSKLSDNRLNAPGAADAKGGILVMLHALRALESLKPPADFGWDVLLNPDEEIGSPGSAAPLAQAAQKAGLALLFEPAFPDGSLVSARKGSGTFTVVFHGRAAHAGRAFDAGRSAVLAMVDFIQNVQLGARDLNSIGGITVNCGRVEGGGAVNIVPELAIARFNARAAEPGDDRKVVDLFNRALDQANKSDGIRAEIFGSFSSPPKPLDARSLPLFEALRDCGQQLGIPITWKPSGGASDGNRLAAAGLPVVDSLGPVGGHLHSDQEYADTASLPQRIKLLTLFLARLAGIPAAGPPIYDSIAVDHN
jgi:glutamate carboxypeptidase